MLRALQGPVFTIFDLQPRSETVVLNWRVQAMRMESIRKLPEHTQFQPTLWFWSQTKKHPGASNLGIFKGIIGGIGIYIYIIYMGWWCVMLALPDSLTVSQFVLPWCTCRGEGGGGQVESWANNSRSLPCYMWRCAHTHTLLNWCYAGTCVQYVHGRRPVRVHTGSQDAYPTLMKSSVPNSFWTR